LEANRLNKKYGIHPITFKYMQQTQPNNEQTTPRPSRKKKITLVALLTIITTYVVYSYLNNSPDPTTWESLRSDYKNIK
jgi:hypothetical protein